MKILCRPLYNSGQCERPAGDLFLFRCARKCYSTADPPPPLSSSCPVEQMDVEGKCALVLNGTSGVGHAFADELLKMKAAHVIITGQHEQTGAEVVCDLNDRYGPACRADFCYVDVTDLLQLQGIFKYVKENFAAMDIFFNSSETTMHNGTDEIAKNFVSKTEGILLAYKTMKAGSVIVNHTSALGLEPNPDMIAQSAASSGFVVACMAFGENKYFGKTQIRMTTLCSELILPVSDDSTGQPFACDGQQEYRNQISIAKSAAYVVKYGPDKSLWLCQKNGVLSIVELEKIITFTEKYEPLYLASS